MKLKLAKFISFIGHPLLTIPIYLAVVVLGFNDIRKASMLFLLIVGCVIVPTVLVMYFKSRNGSYTNFDVSDQQQRKSLFVYILPLLPVVTFVLFKTHQSTNLCLGVMFASVLVIVSQLVNFYVKSSLHVSLNIYLSFLVMVVNLKLGVLLFLFAGLVGWSRIELGRHSKKEVLLGGGIGLLISVLMVCVEHYW